jgi:GTP cyclohydrolase I
MDEIVKLRPTLAAVAASVPRPPTREKAESAVRTLIYPRCGGVVGLASSRIVDAFARRLQMQEALSAQIIGRSRSRSTRLGSA